MASAPSPSSASSKSGFSLCLSEEVEGIWKSLPLHDILNVVHERELGLRRCINEGPCLTAVAPMYQPLSPSDSERYFTQWDSWRQATLDVQATESKDVDFITCAKKAWFKHVSSYLRLLCRQGYFKPCICSKVNGNPQDAHSTPQPISPLPI